jgi:hypothetical protein
MADPHLVSEQNFLNHPDQETASAVAALATQHLYRWGDSLYYVDGAGNAQPFTAQTFLAMEAEGVLRFDARRLQAKRNLMTALHLAIVGSRQLQAAGIKEIRGIVSAPAFRLAGRRLEVRAGGFDARDRVLCTGSPSSERVGAFPLLRQLWSGLLFADPLYEHNLAAFTCAMFARTACRAWPLMVLDGFAGTGKSCGKSTVAQVLSCLIHGTEPAPLTYSGSEDELEKRIGSHAGRPGPNVLWFDNIRGKSGQANRIHSMSLASLTSAHAIKARRLYSDPVPVFDPICIFTMNGARVEADLADRIIRIGLTLPKGERHRPVYIDGAPAMDWALDHRRELVTEIVSILDGLELGTERHTRMYDFEDIALAAGRKAGFTPSFAPGRIHTCDAFVEELISVLDELDGRATPAMILVEVRGNRSYHELNQFMDHAHAGRKTLALRIEERIACLPGQQFRYGPRVVTFSVEHDPKLDQKVVVMDEAGADNLDTLAKSSPSGSGTA